MKTSDTAFLMPAYNPEPGILDAAVAPLLAQTRAADLIIVDDGSTIPVVSLLPEDPRITVLRLDTNVGVTEARNVALRYILEQGYEFIACIDSDDISRTDRMAIQVGALEADPALDLVGSMAPTVDRDGRVLFTRGTAGGADAVLKRLRRNLPFAHSTFCFRRRVVERFGFYSTDFPAAEDYEYLFRIVAGGGKVDCLPDPLVTYLINPDGISSRNRRLQIRTRLKTQWRYFDWKTPGSYLAVAESLATLLIPARVVMAVKRAIGRV
ncbi:glycosyltransferase [Ancylobacter terrae]|uniref:glycosyltransferase n=1 Tax=Ancylobacter sp. sgz301288 TaxID=3342077 RepID=UPI0038597562